MKKILTVLIVTMLMAGTLLVPGPETSMTEATVVDKFSNGKDSDTTTIIGKTWQASGLAHEPCRS